jgi:hypothetical protein
MKVGDLVKYQYLGTSRGSGIILSIRPFDGKQARILWTTAHGQTQIREEAIRYLEVIK